MAAAVAADATSVADALEGRSTERALALASVAGKTMPKVAARAAASILAQARALDGGASPDAVDLDAIRQAVHTLARESRDPALYWEQWLRRVVPQAVARSPEAATAPARAALQGALVVPARWRFQVSAYRARSGCLVAVVAVGGAQASGHDVAKLAPYCLENGRFETSLTPLVPIDEYRMGYLFQTLFIDTALDDVEQGAYTLQQRGDWRRVDVTRAMRSLVAGPLSFGRPDFDDDPSTRTWPARLAAPTWTRLH